MKVSKKCGELPKTNINRKTSVLGPQPQLLNVPLYID